MSVEAGVPRRGQETDPVRRLALDIAELRKQVATLGKSASLRNASISGGDGLVVKDEAGNIRLRLATEEGAILAYDSTGEVVARYGLLAYSDAGEYGLEVVSNGEWIHIGNEAMTWANIANIPASFTPSAHLHPGGDITSAVANATSAASATLAAQANGSEYGFTNTVAGSTFYALWVGNDGGFHFGRNTSSIRYKMNVQDFTRPGDLESLRLVTYDRRPSTRGATTADGLPAEGPAQLIPGAVREFGMIAEEVERVWPEVVTWFDDGDGPKIDGLRYDLIGPRLIPYVQDLIRANRALQEQQAQQAKLIENLTARLDTLEGN